MGSSGKARTRIVFTRACAEKSPTDMLIKPRLISDTAWVNLSEGQTCYGACIFLGQSLPFYELIEDRVGQNAGSTYCSNGDLFLSSVGKRHGGYGMSWCSSYPLIYSVKDHEVLASRISTISGLCHMRNNMITNGVKNLCTNPQSLVEYVVKRYLDRPILCSKSLTNSKIRRHSRITGACANLCERAHAFDFLGDEVSVPHNRPCLGRPGRLAEIGKKCCWTAKQPLSLPSSVCSTLHATTTTTRIH